MADPVSRKWHAEEALNLKISLVQEAGDQTSLISEIRAPADRGLNGSKWPKAELSSFTKKKPPLCPEQSCGSKKQSGELSLTLEPVGKQRALASTGPRATTVSADFFVGVSHPLPCAPHLRK